MRTRLEKSVASRRVSTPAAATTSSAIGGAAKEVYRGPAEAAGSPSKCGADSAAGPDNPSSIRNMPALFTCSAVNGAPIVLPSRQPTSRCAGISSDSARIEAHRRHAVERPQICQPAIRADERARLTDDDCLDLEIPLRRHQVIDAIHIRVVARRQRPRDRPGLSPVFKRTTGMSRLIERITSIAKRRFSGVSGNDGLK